MSRITRILAAAVAAAASLMVPTVAHAAPGNSVVVGDSIPANPTVVDYIAGKQQIKIPGARINKVGCGSDGTFVAGYRSTYGGPVDDYTCAGGSLHTGGKHVDQMLSRAAARGDLNGATKEVAIFAGFNDTYPHLGRAPLSRIEHDIYNGYVNAIKLAKRYAPHAKIKLVGYPTIGTNVCLVRPAPRVNLPLPAGIIHDIENRLQRSGRAAASATGAQFVDLKPVSAQHGMCSNDPWMRGIIDAVPGNLPVHMTHNGLYAVGRVAGS